VQRQYPRGLSPPGGSAPGVRCTAPSGDKPVRFLKGLLALSLLTLMTAFGHASTIGALAGSTAAAPVDRQVWAGLAAAPDHRVRFVVSMREVPEDGAASATAAQIALEEPLAILERAGSIDSSKVYYGANAIVVEGGPGAVRFLGEWPDVAAIRPYHAGAPWEAETARIMETPFASGHITGAVTGPGGTPLASIRVRPSLWTGGSNWQQGAFVDSTADGHYDIGGLATGYYRVMFSDPAGNYVSEYYDDQGDWDSATILSVTDGATKSGIDASLALAGKISGKVTTTGGSGIADIVASAWVNVNGTWQNRGSSVSASNGEYSIGGLPPGTYRVRFADSYTVPRYIAQYYNGQVDINLATPVIVTAGQTTPNINAAMGGYGKIAGKVTGPGGAPALSGIGVDIWQYNPAVQDWDWVSYGTTDTSGNYTADGLVTGDYRVAFSDPLNQFEEEFYNDKPTMEGADNVHVNLGYTTANINASLALKTVSLENALASGWNLVSLPLTLPDPTPASAFASIDGDYGLVYAYNGCLSSNQWKSYNPNIPPVLNTLTAVDPKQGLWLQTTSPVTLRLTGAWPLSTAINLCTGWNLIGYPSATPRSPSTALSGISGKYDLVYAYDAFDTADPWKSYSPSAPPDANDLTTMRPWLGYWIRMTSAATLTVPGR
jgi:hypothetical protein